MSSMRNAVQRRQHRERAQPESRAKWGILEKHKDYSLRAADYNVKKAKIQRLREKARDRNPDEFAFGMMSGKKDGKAMTKGRHGTRENNSLSMETARLLKTQDAGYLRVMGEKVRRNMEQVEEEVRLQDGITGLLNGEGGDDGTKSGGKVIFVDSEQEQRRKVGGERSDYEDEEEDGEADEEEGQNGVEARASTQKERAEPKSRKQLEAEKLLLKETRVARNMKKRTREQRLKKLEALKKQHKDIVAAEEELGLQRARMDNTVGGVNKNGVKWKIRERKR